MNDETHLVTRAANGDSAAFDRLVGIYQNRAVLQAFALLGSRAMAEDAAQEAFLQAWRDLPTLREPATFAAWLRRIVFKFADRQRRHEKPTVPLDTVAQTASNANPIRNIARSETQTQVRDMVETLAPGERDAVVLFYGDGESAARVGAFLGISEVAVKQRLTRARKRLAERMGAMMSELLGEMTASARDTRFVEVARLLREITQVLESDANVLAAYLAPFGKDEGLGAGNDAWASLNVHAILHDDAMPALATGAGEYVAQVAEPILWVTGQQNAPPQGYYRMAIYEAPGGAYEVDWYWHKTTGATLPTDARVLFNRGNVPQGNKKITWEYTPESEYPDALRDVLAKQSPAEKHAEALRNTVHFFWAMWLISSKYVLRDGSQAETPFASLLENTFADARHHVMGKPRTAPEPPAPAPTPDAKRAHLRALADAMTALGFPAPFA